MTAQTTVVLKVAKRDHALRSILEKNRALGGYLVARGPEEISIRTPKAQSGNILTFIKSLGVAESSERNATDLRSELEKQRTLLKSKTKIFDKYMSVLNRAKVGMVVQIERELTRLVQEIELLKGKIRVAEHNLNYAETRIRFRFPNRKMPKPTGDSSFPWLNTVNLTDLLEAFQHED